jgi:hypothetical protein
LPGCGLAEVDQAAGESDATRADPAAAELGGGESERPVGALVRKHYQPRPYGPDDSHGGQPGCAVALRMFNERHDQTHPACCVADLGCWMFNCHAENDGQVTVRRS